MGYRRCPSCGHEVYEHDATVCPFCGAERGRRAPGAEPRSGGGPRKVLTLVILLLGLAGGLHRFLENRAAEGDGKPLSETVAAVQYPEEVPVGPSLGTPEDSVACMRNVRAVLESALAIQAEIEAGLVPKDRIDLLRAELTGTCPVTGERYRIAFDKYAVSIECPAHGSMREDL